MLPKNQKDALIKGYRTFTYGRALGISMVAFAIALSIGVGITTAMGAFSMPSNLSAFDIWAVLIVATVIIIIGSFSQAHLSSAKHLREEEHKLTPKYIAAWLSVLVIGIVVSIMAILFINSSIEPLILLFSLGGVLWVIYISTDVMFEKRFSELGGGAVALWVIFFIGVAEYQLNFLFTNALLLLFVSSVSIVAIFGVTGLTLILDTSKELSASAMRLARK